MIIIDSAALEAAAPKEGRAAAFNIVSLEENYEDYNRVQVPLTNSSVFEEGCPYGSAGSPVIICL